MNKKKFAPDKKSNSKEVYKTNEKELIIEEMERRLKNNPSNTAPLAVLLDFELGTRKGEILAISTKDIVGDKIHIHRQIIEEFDTCDLDNIKSKGFKVVDYTKSEEGDRWLPLTNEAKKIIKSICCFFISGNIIIMFVQEVVLFSKFFCKLVNVNIFYIYIV